MQIPSWFEVEGPTKYNPFTLPEVYWASQRKKVYIYIYRTTTNFVYSFLVV